MTMKSQILRKKITSFQDLISHTNEIANLEREITLFHAKAVQNILKESKELLHPHII